MWRDPPLKQKYFDQIVPRSLAIVRTSNLIYQVHAMSSCKRPKSAKRMTNTINRHFPEAISTRPSTINSTQPMGR